MISHEHLLAQQAGSLFRSFRQKAYLLGGNRRLKIYGKLSRRSGKRMLIQNRVFFRSITEAEQHGYRACKHCMTPGSGLISKSNLKI